MNSKIDIYCWFSHQTQGHLNGWIDRLTVADVPFSDPGHLNGLIDRSTVADVPFSDPGAPKWMDR